MSKYYLVTVGQLSWGDTYGDVEEFDNLKEAAERSVKTSYYDEPVIIVGDRVPLEMIEGFRAAKKEEIKRRADEHNAAMSELLRKVREEDPILYQDAVDRNSRAMEKAIELFKQMDAEGSG